MSTTFPTTIETRDDAPDVPNVKNIGGVRDLETWCHGPFTEPQARGVARELNRLEPK